MYEQLVNYASSDYGQGNCLVEVLSVRPSVFLVRDHGREFNFG